MSIDGAAIFGTLLALLGVLLGFSGDLPGASGSVALFLLLWVGATLATHSFTDVRRAFKAVFIIYQKARLNAAPLIAEIIQVAAVARKEGVLAMESSRASIKDPLLKKAIKYVIDGFDGASVQAILGAEIRIAWEADEATAIVFEGAARLALWMGLLTSVFAFLHLGSETRVGLPLALGLALGQVLLAPWGRRMRALALQRRVAKDVVQLGVQGIQEGLNPTFLQAKLSLFSQR